MYASQQSSSNSAPTFLKSHTKHVMSVLRHLCLRPYLLLLMLFVLNPFAQLTSVSADDFSFDDDSSSIENLYYPKDFLSSRDRDHRLQSHDVNLLGERTDLNTGDVQFLHTDVVLPGNSGLEVAIRRKRTGGFKFPHFDRPTMAAIDAYYPEAQRPRNSSPFSDWTLEVPTISTTRVFEQNEITQQFQDLGSSCEDAPQPLIYRPPSGEPIPFSENTVIDPESISNGMQLSIPGVGSKKLLAANPQGSIWPVDTVVTTLDHWVAKCKVVNGKKIGIIVTSPNGDTYHFDQLRLRPEIGLPVKATSGGSTFSDVLPKVSLNLQVSRVTDVNGNSVDYTYNSEGWLDTITSNDGRQLQVNYRSDGLIDSINAGTRTWTYTYTTVNSNIFLSKVTLPDGRYWSINFSNYPIDPSSGYNCKIPNKQVSITHPDGITGTFTFSEIRHSIGYENASLPTKRTKCTYSIPTEIGYNDVMSITEKSLSGPGIAPMKWVYEYSEHPGGATDIRQAQKWTKVTSPLGEVQKTTFHNTDNVALEGLEYRKEIFTDSSLSTRLSQETYTYEIEPAIGSHWSRSDNPSAAYHGRRNKKTTLLQNGDSFYTENSYNTLLDTSYSYGNPTQVKAWSSVSATPRITDTTYAHNKTKWVLGLPNTVKQNGTLVSQYGYDSLGRKAWENSFGVRVATFAYHTAATYKGALYWVKDALNRNAVIFNNYKAGVSQLITRQDGVNVTRTVDDNGWITSETDAKGYTTSYQYNPVGRITRVIRPKVSVNWADTSISYAKVTTADLAISGGGLVSGQWKQTTTKGTLRTTVYFDAMLRAILVKTEDTADASRTVFNRTRFNALGMPTFSSHPSSTAAATTGVDTTYDGLLRLKTTRENVGLNATTTYSYLSGNRQQVKDAEDNITTSYFSAYGSPSNGAITRIIQPMGVNTYLNRDIYGKLISVQQIGDHNGFPMDQSNYYYYDDRFRLCRHRTPEGGDSVYNYDVQSRVTWSASGQSASSTCDQAAVPSSQRIIPTYDSLDRVEFTNYPDTTPDISTTYDLNSNVLTKNRGGVDWSYTYDELNNLKSENLLIDGRPYNTSYTYNNRAQLNTQTTPGNNTISYNPDAFGRAKQAKVETLSYASGITYHATGQTKQINYANGQIHKLTLNTRKMPYNVYTQKADGSNRAMYLRYNYDAVGNITSILDYAPGGSHRYMGYDALHRLTSTSGSWGTGSFDYGPLGNIYKKTLGSRVVNVTYNSVNRVSSVNDAGVVRTYGYDARGNVTNNGKHSFSYDLSDQPTGVSGVGSYVYDGNLKRVKSIQNGKTTYSVYSLSGQILYTDKDTTNVTENKKTDYIRAAGQTIARIENNTVTYPHNDLLGSPVSATTSTGALDWQEQYTPYGEKRLNPVKNKDNVGYTGHMQDDITGLTYMQARYYDPAIGRFLSIDPVGFTSMSPSSFNRYAYANNNPYLYTDPNGQFGLLVKAIKVAIKGGDVASTFAGAASDANTVFSLSSTAGTGERLMALGSLLSEIGSPVSARDAKIAKKVTTKTPDVTGQKGIVGNNGPTPNKVNGVVVPEIDSKGKLHGPIPSKQDLNKLDDQTLNDLRDDTRNSLPKRKEVTQELGIDPGHARREGDEENLLKFLDKKLGE